MLNDVQKNMIRMYGWSSEDIRAFADELDAEKTLTVEPVGFGRVWHVKNFNGVVVAEVTGTNKGWRFCEGINTHYNDSIDTALKNVFPNKTVNVVNVSALKPVWVFHPNYKFWTIDGFILCIKDKTIIVKRAILQEDKDLMADVLFFAEELFK